MLDGVNKESDFVLIQGDLPQQQQNNIQEARQVRQKENYTESRERNSKK